MDPFFARVGGCTIRRCPLEWKNLYEGDDTTTKFCAVCWKDVHLATSPEQVKEFAERGWCIAYQRDGESFMGYGKRPKISPEHAERELFEAISRQKSGEATLDDLRFIALRFLEHLERAESLRYLRLFINAGGKADSQLIFAANRLGIDATDPAPVTI